MTAVEELVAKARREAVLQGLVSQVRLEIKFVGCLAHISSGYSDNTTSPLTFSHPGFLSALSHCFISWDLAPIVS